MINRINKEREKRIDEISQKVAQIIKVVANDCMKMNKELGVLDELNIGNYMPTPQEIARYYGLRIEYKKMANEILSYLNRKLLTIYISEKYINERYVVEKLVAHELGHFFMDNSSLSAMNNDVLNEFLPEEIIKEYEANVFAVFLMPQIMAGEQWDKFSPRILNRKVYKRVKKDD